MHNGTPAGMFVLSPATGSSKARAKMFPFFRNSKLTSQRFQIINKKFSLLSRVVVAPEYRGIGLAVYLAKAARIFAPTPYVECVAAMAEFSSFLSRAGYAYVGRTEVMASKKKSENHPRQIRRLVETSAGSQGIDMGAGNIKMTSGARYYVAPSGENLHEAFTVT